MMPKLLLPCIALVFFQSSAAQSPSHIVVEDVARGSIAGSANQDLTVAEFSPLAVRASQDPTRLVVGVADSSIVEVVWESRNTFTRSGVGGSYLTLRDDGTQGDEVAGDYRFTIDNLLQNVDVFTILAENGPAVALGYPGTFTLVDSSGTERPAEQSPLLYLITLDPTTVPIPRVNRSTIAVGVDHTAYVVSIDEPVQDKQAIAQDFFSVVADSVDFLFISSIPSIQNPLAGEYTAVRNEVLGIGLPVFDDSPDYGSSGVLQGIVRLFPSVPPQLLNHELLHRWASWLDPSLDLGRGHWGVIERPTSGYGHTMWGAYPRVLGDQFDGLFRALPIGTTAGEYNDLELYLMGLLPAADVESPIRTLINPTYLDSEPICCPPPVVDVFDSDGVRELEIQEIIDVHGPRSPDTTNSQKHFRAGLLVAFGRPLTDLEFAYFDYIMRAYEKPTDPAYTTFAEATRWTASISTRLFNSAPAIVSPIADTTIVTSTPFELDLLATFSDADGDSLTFTAQSSDPTVASASVVESLLVVTPIGSGSSVIAVEAHDTAGGTTRVEFRVTFGSAVSTTGPMARPSQFALQANFPNPFRTHTTIQYDLPRQTDLTLTVYDVQGRRIAELVNGTMPFGTHTVVFNSRTLPAGVYFYRLESVGYTEARYMTVVR